MSAVAVTRLAALDIRVLDAQNESPAAVSRPEVAEQSGACIPQMQGAGGRRCETRDDGRGHISRLYPFE